MCGVNMNFTVDRYTPIINLALIGKNIVSKPLTSNNADKLSLSHFFQIADSTSRKSCTCLDVELGPWQQLYAT
jgi:hypothetical protein